MGDVTKADIEMLKEQVKYLQEIRKRIEERGVFVLTKVDANKIDLASQSINMFRMILQLPPDEVHKT
jgi:hypothetical protein